MIATYRSQRVTCSIAAGCLLFACSTRSTVADPPAAAPPSEPVAAAPSADTSGKDSLGWLVVDTAARTATLELVVTASPSAPSALMNGYRASQARVVVPLGWTVRWNWRSADSASPHSLVVMVQREKIPLEGGRAAFSNAMTRMVTEGLRPGQNDQTTFVADEAGWFWMLCGVPGHAIKGEWLELRVDPDAKTASVLIKKA